MAGAVEGSLSERAEHVGVDGCPGGWVAAGVDGDGSWSYGLADSFESLWNHLDQSTLVRVLVDIPIGLCENRVRECDEAARDLLGCRWNSVFRTPVRSAVDLKRREGDEDRRPEASDRNDARTGYGLSAQVWNITDNIAELDDFFRDHHLSLDGVVREAHPELAFMAFNGQPVAYSKTDERGRRLRRTLLHDESPEAIARAEEAVESLPSGGAGADDVFDAIALALAAGADLATVPEELVDDAQPRIYFPAREPEWDAQSYFSG